MNDPVWIDERDVLALHSRLLGLEGGAVGIRDIGLLESAIARARQIYEYGEGLDIIDTAAAYVAGIVRNHPFIDGNKRTGFVVGVLFLEMNGYFFTATEEDAAQAIMGLASGTLDEASLARCMRANIRRQ